MSSRVDLICLLKKKLSDVGELKPRELPLRQSYKKVSLEEALNNNERKHFIVGVVEKLFQLNKRADGHCVRKVVLKEVAENGDKLKEFGVYLYDRYALVSESVLQVGHYVALAEPQLIRNFCGQETNMSSVNVKVLQLLPAPITVAEVQQCRLIPHPVPFRPKQDIIYTEIKDLQKRRNLNVYAVITGVLKESVKTKTGRFHEMLCLEDKSCERVSDIAFHVFSQNRQLAKNVGDIIRVHHAQAEEWKGKVDIRVFNENGLLMINGELRQPYDLRACNNDFTFTDTDVMNVEKLRTWIELKRTVDNSPVRELEDIKEHGTFTINCQVIAKQTLPNNEGTCVRIQDGTKCNSNVYIRKPNLSASLNASSYDCENSYVDVLITGRLQEQAENVKEDDFVCLIGVKALPVISNEVFTTHFELRLEPPFGLIKAPDQDVVQLLKRRMAQTLEAPVNMEEHSSASQRSRTLLRNPLGLPTSNEQTTTNRPLETSETHSSLDPARCSTMRESLDMFNVENDSVDALLEQLGKSSEITTADRTSSQQITAGSIYEERISGTTGASESRQNSNKASAAIDSDEKDSIEFSLITAGQGCQRKQGCLAGSSLEVEGSQQQESQILTYDSHPSYKKMKLVDYSCSQPTESKDYEQLRDSDSTPDSLPSAPVPPVVTLSSEDESESSNRIKLVGLSQHEIKNITDGKVENPDRSKCGSIENLDKRKGKESRRGDEHFDDIDGEEENVDTDKGKEGLRGKCRKENIDETNEFRKNLHKGKDRESHDNKGKDETGENRDDASRIEEIADGDKDCQIIDSRERNYNNENIADASRAEENFDRDENRELFGSRGNDENSGSQSRHKKPIGNIQTRREDDIENSDIDRGIIEDGSATPVSLVSESETGMQVEKKKRSTPANVADVKRRTKRNKVTSPSNVLKKQSKEGSSVVSRTRDCLSDSDIIVNSSMPRTTRQSRIKDDKLSSIQSYSKRTVARKNLRRFSKDDSDNPGSDMAESESDVDFEGIRKDFSQRKRDEGRKEKDEIQRKKRMICKRQRETYELLTRVEEATFCEIRRHPLPCKIRVKAQILRMTPDPYRHHIADFMVGICRDCTTVYTYESMQELSVGREYRCAQCTQESGGRLQLTWHCQLDLRDENNDELKVYLAGNYMEAVLGASVDEVLADYVVYSDTLRVLRDVMCHDETSKETSWYELLLFGTESNTKEQPEYQVMAWKYLQQDHQCFLSNFILSDNQYDSL